MPSTPCSQKARPGTGKKIVRKKKPAVKQPARGYVQVYTGNGKGKTTAALGLLMRACGAGLRVYLGQFLKNGRFSEIRALRQRFPEVKIEQYGLGRFISPPPSPSDLAAARAGFSQLRQALLSRQYDLVIADEINVAVSLGLLPLDEVLAVIRQKPRSIEFVLTGRNAHRQILELADLVTDMRVVKHYFASGVPARRGIEN